MKRCFFVPADNNNLKYAQMLANSLKKFHPKEEIVLFNEDQIKATGDPHFWYRATPALAKTLFEQGFDEVCKLDADYIIMGDLSDIWSGDFDVAVTNNSNPREAKTYPVSILDIHPLAYVNAGFVVMKNKQFVDNWFKLCYSDHFNSFQFKEQDLLNILIFFFTEQFGGPYKVKFLDKGNKWYGLISKQYTPMAKLVDNKIILPKNEEWPRDEDKQLMAYHFAGGNRPDKYNYRLIFPPEIVKFIDKLVK